MLAPHRAGAHNWGGPRIASALAPLRALDDEASARAVLRARDDGDEPAARERRLRRPFTRRPRRLTLATRAPDTARARSSLHGWINREEYGDANTLLAYDASQPFLDPALGALLEATVSEHDVGHSLTNLAHLPALVRTGDADASVPPYFARRLARLLDEAGAEAALSVLAGKPHWWWDTASTNDGGAMFDREVRDFLAAHLPAPGAPAASAVPAAFTVVSLNPATFLGRGGVRVLQLETPGRRGVVEVAAGEAGACTLATMGVRRVRVGPPALAVSCAGGVVVDGTTFSRDAIARARAELGTDDAVSFVRDGAGSVAVAHPTRYEQNERGPATCRPARRAFFSPALVVVDDDADADAVTVLRPPRTRPPRSSRRRTSRRRARTCRSCASRSSPASSCAIATSFASAAPPSSAG